MEEKVFDLEQSLSRIDGDRELYADLIRFFVEDSPKLLEQLRAGLRDNDPRAVQGAAHTLKGLAANFSAKRAVDAADLIERHAASTPPDLMSDSVARLTHEISLLEEALRALPKDFDSQPV